MCCVPWLVLTAPSKLSCAFSQDTGVLQQRWIKQCFTRVRTSHETLLRTHCYHYYCYLLPLLNTATPPIYLFFFIRRDKLTACACWPADGTRYLAPRQRNFKTKKKAYRPLLWQPIWSPAFSQHVKSVRMREMQHILPALVANMSQPCSLTMKLIFPTRHWWLQQRFFVFKLRRLAIGICSSQRRDGAQLCHFIWFIACRECPDLIEIYFYNVV